MVLRKESSRYQIYYFYYEIYEICQSYNQMTVSVQSNLTISFSHQGQVKVTLGNNIELGFLV